MVRPFGLFFSAAAFHRACPRVFWVGRCPPPPPAARPFFRGRAVGLAKHRGLCPVPLLGACPGMLRLGLPANLLPKNRRCSYRVRLKSRFRTLGCRWGLRLGSLLCVPVWSVGSSVFSLSFSSLFLLQRYCFFLTYANFFTLFTLIFVNVTR